MFNVQIETIEGTYEAERIIYKYLKDGWKIVGFSYNDSIYKLCFIKET